MLPTSWLESATQIVGDASGLINLNATGEAAAILTAIPSRLVVVDTVIAELEEGRAKGRHDAEQVNELVHAGLIEIVALGSQGLAIFESLVVGPATDTLDDGEAATLACAIERKGVPLIDEHKANRISAQRYPALRLGCTIDLLANDVIERALGQDRLGIAVLGALTQARMQVPPHKVDWVVGMVGVAQALRCTSLPFSTRQRLEKLGG